MLSEFIIRKELSKQTLKGAKAVREIMINSIVGLLYNYRVNCAQNSSPSQLILPDSLKLLPLYLLTALKSPVSFTYKTIYRPSNLCLTRN